MLTLLLSLLAPCRASIYEGYHIVLFKDNVHHAHQLEHIERIQAKHHEAKSTQRTEHGGAYHGIKAHYKHLNMYYVHAHDDLVDHIRSLEEIQLVESEGYLSMSRITATQNAAAKHEAAEVFDDLVNSIHCQDEVFWEDDWDIAPQAFLSATVVAPSKPKVLRDLKTKMVHDLFAPEGLSRISHKLWSDYRWSEHEYIYSPEIISHPVVYIMDTGVQIDHIEFEGRVSNGPICEHCVNADDEEGHGTHVLGTIIGKTVGVARKASAVSLKVIDRSKQARISALLAAFDFVLSEPTPDNLKMVNMSLNKGFYYSSLNHAVNTAGRRGVHIVVSAGNDGKRLTGFVSPASALFSIVVGSIDAKDARIEGTNWGEDVDFVAPGLNVLSSIAGPTNKHYKLHTGTSMATPHVTGVICYMLTLYGPMSPEEVKAQLYDWSTKTPVGFGDETRARILYNGSGY